jgi:hypothetical protein
LADASAVEAIKQSFAEKSGGHLKCREIRKAKTLSCRECVEVAAALLEKHSEEAKSHGGGIRSVFNQFGERSERC